MRHPEERAHRDQSGFTLIEVLVAMTVLALFASLLLRGVVDVRADAAWFDDRAQLTEVARAVLDEAVANRLMRPGTYRGEQGGRRWTLTASTLDLRDQLPTVQNAGTADMSPAAAGAGQPHWIPQRLVVHIEAEGRPVVLETIRLAAAP